MVIHHIRLIPIIALVFLAISPDLLRADHNLIVDIEDSTPVSWTARRRTSILLTAGLVLRISSSCRRYPSIMVWLRHAAFQCAPGTEGRCRIVPSIP